MRIGWLDNSKGIGMVLVVLGHTAIPENIYKFIYSFHMPLFFFLSGFLYRRSGANGEWLTKKIFSLLWPYYLFNFIYILYLIVCKNDIGINSYFNFISGISSPITPLWFLTALFSVEVIFKLLDEWLRDDFLLVASCITISLIGYLNNIYFYFGLPFNIHIAFFMLPYYFLGYKYKNHVNFTKKTALNIRNILLIIFCGLIIYILSQSNIAIDVRTVSFGNKLTFIVTSLLGIVFVLYLAAVTSRYNLCNTIIGYIGKNSLIILSVHTVYPNMVRDLFDVNFNYRLDSVIALILIILTIEVVSKRMKFIINPLAASKI